MARTPISIETKMEVLEALSTKSKMDVAREFGIGYSTVKKIKKNEDEILKKASGGNLLRKRCRPSPNEEVGNALIAWYHEMKAENVPITGPIMLEKAKELAAVFGHEDFNPSHGWLERLKARNNIRFKPLPNRTISNNREEPAEWVKDILPKLIEGYDPNDVFNADETTLLYKVVPPLLTGNHPHSTTASKDKLTLLFLCNSTGNEKKVFAIGNVPNPPCFEKEATPLPYYSSENALMTDWIWCDILQKLDQSLGKRKIILFVDREACHNSKIPLQNIKLAFIPPNSSNMFQPLNQGIIRLAKIYYRARLSKTLISALNEGIIASDFDKTFDVLQALRILESAWFSVPSAAIVESFQKVGFPDNEVYFIEDSAENSVEVAELEELLQEDFDSFVECDKDLDCFESCLSSKTSNLPPAKQKMVKLDDDAELENKVQRVTYKDALKALSTVRRYLNENFTEYDAYYEVEEMIRLSAYANGLEENLD